MPRPSLSERDAYDVETLTDIAVEVFRQRGYDGTRMEHVAKAAGVTKAALYYHVQGKEELLRRGSDRALNALFHILEQPGAQADDPVERLAYVLRRMVDVVLHHTAAVAVLVRIRGNTEVERAAIARKREFNAAVTRVLEEATAAGALVVPTTPPVMSQLLLGMVNSLVEWYRADGPVRPDQIGDAVCTTVLEGLRPRP